MGSIAIEYKTLMGKFEYIKLSFKCNVFKALNFLHSVFKCIECNVFKCNVFKCSVGRSYEFPA